ncbi:uncharacterized protein LOC120844216 [Ixodes scapularis]|uniref:uncharacterized protein LOC120844216 n=1 Tax=Ixodes scapularis TaxID=6945 RepID=UPI001A9E1CF9|nr:uncharacterized protein LOC120844216 [Ixodes scapularis]
MFPKTDNVYRKWITAIRRDESRLFKVSKATKVCSKHFVETDFVRNVASGRRLLYEHAVPSVFSFTKPRVTRKPPKERLPPVIHQALQDLEDPNRNLEQESQNHEDPFPIPELQEVYRLKAQLEAALAKCEVLEARSVPFGVEKFRANDEDIQFYTGLPNYRSFLILLNFVDAGENGRNILMQHGRHSSVSQKAGRRRKLSAENQLFLVLMKLKGGIFHKHLGHLFDISMSTVSKLFSAWMSFLYLNLTQLGLWLPREAIDTTMPVAFLDKYPTTRVIIDATEVRCEVASSFVTQSGTYSYYKSTNTFKGLVGISPNGLVTFVSELYMGSVSDKEIVIKSGLITMPFDQGDSVMADKGFKIADLLKHLGVTLNIPPFLNRGKFSVEEVEETQDIAALRIHVERRIQRIKSFHIFDRPIPISLAPLANQIWTVCTILTNMQSPLIKDNE